MQERISSLQTFVMKLIFPAFWISGFGFGTLNLWLGTFRGENDQQPEDFIKWQFLIMWIIGTAFILWSVSRLKRVRIDANNLYVSNYFKEIVTPLNNIHSVTENRWLNIHPVTIHFKKSTHFGDKISFMPTIRYFAFWSSHPVVSRLRSLAKTHSKNA